MIQQKLPDHARETIQAIDNRLAELERERSELLKSRATVIKLFQSQMDMPTPHQGRSTIHLSDCPLTVEEMHELRDRHAIIRAMAERDSRGTVQVGEAAKWLYNAGIVSTTPANLRKALTRRMKTQQDTWEDLGGGTFRLMDHLGVQYSGSREWMEEQSSS